VTSLPQQPFVNKRQQTRIVVAMTPLVAVTILIVKVTIHFVIRINMVTTTILVR